MLADTPPEHVVLQCGSGVTACVDALAMEVAGLHGAALYAAPGASGVRIRSGRWQRGLIRKRKLLHVKVRVKAKGRCRGYAATAFFIGEQTAACCARPAASRVSVNSRRAA